MATSGEYLFPDSRLAMQTHIELHSESRFIGWEMQCLGRPVINERFDRGQIRSSLSSVSTQSRC